MQKFLIVLTFSIMIISGCDENKKSLKSSTPLSYTIVAVTPASESPKIKPDTIYRDFYYEDTLKNGCRFGMTVSEWNRQLAILAKRGIIESLKESSRFYSEYSAFGAYNGFVSVGNSNLNHDNKLGFYLSGLFDKAKDLVDTIVIFRLGKKVTDEPILVGMQLDYNIPLDDMQELIDVIIKRDNFKYIGGSHPYIETSPLQIEDFFDVIPILKEKASSSNIDPKHISTTSGSKTLYNAKNFYSVIELKETRDADVKRDSEYKITALFNSYRNYTLTQKIFSINQFKINIFDYMTQKQIDNYDDSIKTNQLIKKSLNSK